ANFHDDLSVMADFAETHFTTGRFAGCRERIAILLAKPEIKAGTKIALRLIGVANLLALGNTTEVPPALMTLGKTITEQKSDFRIRWTFNGTLHFINQEEVFAPYRAWLNQFFGMAQGENRDAILEVLRAAQSRFPK